MLREVCEQLTTSKKSGLEEFLEAFGLPSTLRSDEKLKHEILFDILKRHFDTPVQLVRNVCATLFGDSIVVELLDKAVFSKPPLSLHLVRPLEEIRKIYIQRGRILIVEPKPLPSAKELGSFFTDLDPTSEVTILEAGSSYFDRNIRSTIDSWQQNQGQ